MPAPSQTQTSSPAVAELQRTLATYAKATGMTAADPGPIDGKVGIRTILAVAAVLPYVPGLPQELRVLATLAPIAVSIDSAREQATKLIRNNASTIAKAILAVAVVQAYQGKPPAGTGPVLNPAGGIVPIKVTQINPGGVAITPGTIWFFDHTRGVYRVAIPKGLMGLGAGYVEIQPQTTAPSGGYQTTRTDFLIKTGQWYMTPLGIGGIVAGSGVVIGGLIWAIRAAVR